MNGRTQCLMAIVFLCSACASSQQGEAGPAGPQGPQGATGATGIVGPTGPMGTMGTTGAMGAMGQQGSVGPTGPQGGIGPTGPAGSYLIDAGSGLALVSNSLALSSCPTGQILKSQGSTWACASDDANGYAAGAGLALVNDTFSVAAGGITNTMLQNSQITISTGPGLSATAGSTSLGGAVTLSNTGVLSVGASGALSSSGGQSPTLSLGIVPVGNGGTGATTVSAALANLQAAPESGSGSYIQNQTSTAQPASLHVTGTMRMGSESGTADGPGYPGNGLIHRRLRSVLTTNGSIVAIAGTVRLERDGSAGGFKVENTSGVTNPNIKCFVMNFAGTVSGKMVTVGAGATVPLIDSAENIVMIDCQVQYSHPNAILDEAMSVQLSRTSFGADIWTGFVTSTTNQ